MGRRKTSLGHTCDAKDLLKYAKNKAKLPVSDIQFKETDDDLGDIYELLSDNGNTYGETWFNGNGRPHIRSSKLIYHKGTGD